MAAHRRAGIVTTSLLSIALVAACGGGTASTAPTGASGPSATPATATAPAASDAPTTAPVSADPLPSVGTLPSFDLDDLVANLDGVDSYRVVVTSGGVVAYETKVVTTPELRREVLATDGTRIVIIGDEAWAAEGDGELTPVPGAMAAGMISVFDPMLLMGAFTTPGALAGAQDIGVETKNDMQARHYRIEASSLVGSLASMPPGSSIDIWVADDGHLVSLAIMSGGDAGGDVSIDVFDVNDPSITIERP